ncbi:MAG: hypothetical protein AAB875_03575, partial [Patescibacteria group bacterium]
MKKTFLFLGVCVSALLLIIGIFAIVREFWPETQINVGVDPRTLLRLQGGTGTSTRPGQGFLLYGDDKGEYGPASLTAGSNVTISTTTHNSAGIAGITISSTGGGAGGGPVNPFVIQTFGGTEHSASSTRPFYFGMGLLTSSSTIGSLTFGTGSATSSLSVDGHLSASSSISVAASSTFSAAINSGGLITANGGVTSVGLLTARGSFSFGGVTFTAPT